MDCWLQKERKKEKKREFANLTVADFHAFKDRFPSDTYKWMHFMKEEASKPAQ